MPKKQVQVQFRKGLRLTLTELCRVEEGDASIRIEFFESKAEEDEKRPCMVLRIDRRGVSIDISSALPVFNWMDKARVVARVVQFIEQNDLEAETRRYR